MPFHVIVVKISPISGWQDLLVVFWSLFRFSVFFFLAAWTEKTDPTRLGCLFFTEQVLGFSDLAAEITTGQEKAEVARLSKTFDDINSQLDFMLGQEPFKPIDWKKWESELPGLENIVAEFKNASQSLELPSFADDFSSEAETGFANLLSTAEEVSARADVRVEELKVDLADHQEAEARLSELTIDEIVAEHPEWLQEANKELEEANWV
eukprot:TRINITY_DN3479_c0_g1_i4.p1 TRINITY_DN3479_c0_g1~~TRINITY_DN3479_c0_g1_i4.p1  ORF type:complete len:209 (-),score=68.03 TRINITY_DN3479_c0_g1_i4:51-677(-)